MKNQYVHRKFLRIIPKKKFESFHECMLESLCKNVLYEYMLECPCKNVFYEYMLEYPCKNVLYENVLYENEGEGKCLI